MASSHRSMHEWDEKALQMQRNILKNQQTYSVDQRYTFVRTWINGVRTWMCVRAHMRVRHIGIVHIEFLKQTQCETLDACFESV